MNGSPANSAAAAVNSRLKPSGLPGSDRPKIGTQYRKSYGAYLHVRDRILDPRLEKRSFQDEGEVASYFDIGFDSATVIRRLFEKGFLTKVRAGRIELCRFDAVTLFRTTNVRVKLDAYSFQIALPRLSQADLDRIQAAGLEFSKGPRLPESLDHILSLESILHQAAELPVISSMTEELQRIITPYTYFDVQRTAFDNLAPIFLSLPHLLAQGRVGKVCRIMSQAYQENSRLLANEIREFTHLRRK
jgi:DNA-binding GntR family transcriptional regulator